MAFIRKDRRETIGRKREWTTGVGHDPGWTCTRGPWALY